MNEPLVVEAFDTLLRDLSALWAASSETEQEGRERIYRTVWAMRNFRAFFESVITEGKMHQHQLQALKRGTL